jgi:hypothetical protein
MATTRRNFLKAAASGASVAAGYKIFFPKPATAYSLNYLLSQNGRSDAVMQNFLQASVAMNPSNTLQATDNAVIAVVEATQSEFINRNFNENPTPFTQRLNNPNNPLWGRQRTEDLGPNPGFGTVQIVSNSVSAISFSGSTTAGIDSAIQVLAADENLDPLVLDSALIPSEVQYEDWGSWAGEVNPATGEILSTTSLTRYGTRFGSVIRRYEVVEPGVGGFGIITMFIDGGNRVKTNLEIEVRFA